MNNLPFILEDGQGEAFIMLLPRHNLHDVMIEPPVSSGGQRQKEKNKQLFNERLGVYDFREQTYYGILLSLSQVTRIPVALVGKLS